MPTTENTCITKHAFLYLKVACVHDILFSFFVCRLTEESGFISDGTGNYSVDSKCAWLVDTGEPNRTIRFHLEEFATECGWDHIFIHDGDSAFSPLTAAYRYCGSFKLN